MKLMQVLYGIVTFIPGVNRLLALGSGGTGSTRYCYSVWLRHLVIAKNNKLNYNPKIIAELGPGDSLGIGLAGLISGCEKYYAFDVVEHTNIEMNLKVFDELVRLFKSKSDIPDEKEFPKVKPFLDDYSFPQDILNKKRLDVALDNSRLEKIRNSIKKFRHQDSLIQYKAPWFNSHNIEKHSVDMIYSQAVLEHVDNLQETYHSMYSWLKPSGFISNQIDFKCHGTAEEWNGHWTYSNFIWKIIRGNRPYSLNREPYSTHIRIMKDEGFKVICEKKTTLKSSLKISQLAQRYQFLSSEDLTTSGCFVQAIKKSNIKFTRPTIV